MQQGESVTIHQIKNIKTLVEDREIELMEEVSSLWKKIDQMEEFKERRVKPRWVTRGAARGTLSLVRCALPASTLDDALTDEYRAWLHKKRAEVRKEGDE